MLFKKNIESLAAFGGGKMHSENLDFKDIVFNSKDIKKGDVFLALKGENHDGHKFISEAYSLGAICVVSEKKIENQNYILVENTNTFLEKIARKQRNLFDGLVIGITGSNGKTTTKETLYKYYKNKLGEENVLKSFGNYNNFFGLCFSLLELRESHKVGFFEIGTNNVGEIAKLAEVLRMNISIITNIGYAHLEGLKSLKGVANEKTDIYAFTEDSGYCIGNIPYEFLKLGKKKSHKKKNFLSTENDQKKLLSKAIEIINNQLKLKSLPEEVYRFLDQKIDVSGRFEIKKSKSKAIIIDDAYNANPDSFLYAFQKILDLGISKIPFEKKILKNLKRICVMGKMGELGEKSEELHEYILKEASLIFDLVYVLDFKTNLNESNIQYMGRENLKSKLNENINEDVLIFFKGSRSVKMENIIDDLI